ncbi:MAG: hypothetical protein SFU56_08895 [Capsulimonadales bacterium]|nr:hypothetical protein [Capsulimonadales bacterium]
MSRFLRNPLLTFLMVFPASYNVAKAVFMVFVIGETLWAIVRGERFRIHTGVVLGLLTVLFLGMFLALYDHLQLPFAQWRQANVFLTAPLIFLLFTLLYSHRPDFGPTLHHCLCSASFFIAVNALAYLGFGLIGRPYPLEFLDLDYRRGIDERGFAAYSTNNLPILCFTVPYLLANVLYTGNRSRFAVLTLALSVLAALASLRVAVILSVVGSAVVLFGLVYLKADSAGRRTIRRGIVLAATAPLVAGVIGYLLLPSGQKARLGLIVEGIYLLKLSRKVSGEDSRYEQANYWLRAWERRPWFGHGLSSTELITSSIVKPGTVQNPYGYELTYLRLLSEIGLLPLLLYAYLLLRSARWLAECAWRGETAERREALGHLLGMIGFLFASGTNGYLLTFGVAWTVFLPVAYGNRLLTEETA